MYNFFYCLFHVLKFLLLIFGYAVSNGPCSQKKSLPKGWHRVKNITYCYLLLVNTYNGPLHIERERAISNNTDKWMTSY